MKKITYRWQNVYEPISVEDVRIAKLVDKKMIKAQKAMDKAIRKMFMKKKKRKPKKKKGV